MDKAELNDICEQKWRKKLDEMTREEFYGLASQLENENPEAAKQFRAMYNSATDDTKSDKQSEKEEIISDDMLVKNTIELNKLSTQHKLSPELQKAIDSLEVVDDEGKTHDVKQEIIDTAKVSVALDMVTSQKISKEEYDKKFDAEVNHILSTILTTSAGLKGDEDNVQTAKYVPEDIKRLYNGVKVKVSARSFMSSISGHLTIAEKRAEELSVKFKDKGLSFFKSINTKIQNVDNKLTNKFGKVYTGIRNSAKNMAIYGGASIIGAPGMVAFAAYQGYNRLKPIVNDYKKEKEAGKVKGFADYSNKHPDKLVMAGLYTISAVAGAAASFIPGNGALKLAKIGTAALGSAATGIYTAIKGGSKKEVLKQVGISAAMTAAGYGIAEGVKYFSGASAVETNAETENIVTEQDPKNTTIPAVQGAVQEPVDIENERISDSTPAQQETSETTKGQSEVQAESQNYTPDRKVQEKIYVKNFNLLPKDAQTLIKAYDVKNLPNGMTIEMAANLARVNYLYYGEDDGLKILYGCEETEEINSKEYFAKLTTKFHTKPGDNILIGFPTEEGYQADPNIHARITKIDCEEVTISRDVKVPEQERGDVQEDNPVQKRRPEPKAPDQLPAKQPVLKATPAPKALDPIQSNVEIQNQDWTHVNPRTGEGTEGLLNIELKGTPVENAGATGGGIHAQHNADMIANNPELQEAEIKDGKLVDKSGKAINQGWTKMGERTQVETSTDGDATSSTGDASTSTKENETTTLKSPIKKPLTYQEQLIMNAYNQTLGKSN